VKRGEIRWYTFRLPDKRRPVLILTRAQLVDRIGELIVVPATRTVRGLIPNSCLAPKTGCLLRAR
jgi:mRNA interferase MazF